LSIIKSSQVAFNQTYDNCTDFTTENEKQMIKTYIKIHNQGLYVDLSVTSWQYRQTNNTGPSGYADIKQ